MKTTVSFNFLNIALIALCLTSVSVLSAPQALFAAQDREEVAALASPGAKTFSNVSIKDEARSINSASKDLQEINEILQATSRKIALLDPDSANTTTAPTYTAAPVRQPAVIQSARLTENFEEDIRKQSMQTITDGQSIDSEFLKAKEIKTKAGNMKSFIMDEPIVYSTQEEIIKSAISPELLDRRIDLDFDETSLGDIILSVSKLAGTNIVLDPTLKGSKFDLHLESVTIQEALLLIADSFKLGFKRIGDSLYVTHREDLKEQSETSRVFKLKNINVTEAKQLLGEMTKKVQSSEDLNSLIAVGQPEEIEKMEKAINRLDNPQPQVVLEAKIIEISRDGLKELGIDWSNELTMGFQEKNRPLEFDNIETSAGDAIKVFSMARNPLAFTTILKMLENQNKAKILSSPSVTTLNGKKSQIFVGDRIPYTVTNVTGGVATTDVRWVEPGIRLTITPSIIGDDFVVIKVEPEVSFIFTFRGPNDEFPHIKTREATAYVRIKNNEPFILGGLLGQEDKKNLYKVPLLGNIPWIGNLFSYETNTSSDVELIITITPTIVYGNLH